MSRHEIRSGEQSIDLDIEVHGQGRPVVLIHGWPLTSASWRPQVEALQGDYQVVTYDRRGFGASDRPASGYDYDTLADDLAGVLEELDLRDVTLVGFSMGGGEVARYVSRHGQDRLRSVVFVGAVTPYLRKTGDNPDGPLDDASFGQMRGQLVDDRDAFFDDFVEKFYSVPKLLGLTSSLKVSEEQKGEAVAVCRQSDPTAALACMDAWAGTDFRADLAQITVPVLVVHGDGDQPVPFEGSGKRTHEALPHSELVLIEGAPHGLGVSHAEELNAALRDFLA